MTKLYYYSDFVTACWAKNPQHWRALTGKAGQPLKCSHKGVPPPRGWRKGSGELAFDGVEPVPTMRGLVKALTR